MTNKEKIRKFLLSIADADCCNSQVAKIIEKKILPYIDSLKEEPVSDDLEIEIKHCIYEPFFDLDGVAVKGATKYLTVEDIADIARHFANWQKKQDQETIEIAEDHAMLAGMEKAKEQIMKNLWKPADGDNLPEYEREVVVFTQNFPNDAGMMMVAIGHRPTPEGYDGKSLTTGEVEHYTPKTYDKGGWNIPDVKWWLDCLLPNMEED